MSYIEKKYISLISHKLPKFSQSSANVYNFRCPVCGDSESKKTKKRGYIYLRENQYWFKCHNCNAAWAFQRLLKYLDQNLYQEFRLEKFKDREVVGNNPVPPKPKIENKEFNAKPVFENIQSIKSLPDDHLAKQYCLNRKLPKTFFKDLFYVEDYSRWACLITGEPIKAKYRDCADPRLIIPFRNFSGEMIALQARALNPDAKLRYVTLKFSTEPKFFGLDRLNPEQMVFVTEGPFDSMFVPNGIAMAGSALDLSYIAETFKITLTNIVMIYDNEPRNKEIVKAIKGTIDKGYSVVIWPDTIKQKDINDMVLAGKSKLDIFRIIKDNVVSGLEATLKLNRWKKV